MNLQRLVLYAPLVLVLGLFAWCYYANTTIIAFYIASHDILKAFAILLCFNALFFVDMWCLVVVMKGPGQVQSSQEEAADVDGVEVALDHMLTTSASADVAEQQDSRVEDALSSSSSELSDQIEQQLDDFVSKASPYVGLLDNEVQFEAAAEHSLTAKANGAPRYCRKCNVAKPDRSHHCSVCKMCVLKMDHHCGVVGVCVGHLNYKAFLLFLGYTTLICISSCISSVVVLIDYTSTHVEGFDSAVVSWALMMCLGFLFSLLICSFLVFHLYLVKKNRTTIENMERTRIRFDHGTNEDSLTREQRRALKKASAKLNPFDMGWRSNFHSVFGTAQSQSSSDKWYTYILPFRHPVGDGYRFRVNRVNLHRLQEMTRSIQSGSHLH